MDEARTNTQEERLQQEILADARTRAERIVARATTAAKSARERAEKESRELREKSLSETRAAAEQKARNLLQGIWMEERRHWLVKREECLQEFLASLLKEAEGAPAGDRDRLASLGVLFREALAAMGEDRAMTAWVAPADLSLATPAWLAEQAGHPLPTVSVKADATIGGGVRLCADDGSRLYDNTYAARLGRLQEEFRQELCGCDK